MLITNNKVSGKKTDDVGNWRYLASFKGLIQTQELTDGVERNTMVAYDVPDELYLSPKQ